MLESRPMKHRQLFFPLLVSSILTAAQAIAPSASQIAAGDIGAVETTKEPHHHLALQNNYVWVFKLEVAPHQATLMHHHRHDCVFVTLGPAVFENDVAGKPPTTLKFQDGETGFAPGGYAHIVENLSNQPFRNVTVELLQDQKAHPSPNWDEDRGLRILNGGTQDILFVKDGVRASELQLSPGGVVPKHEHVGPHLVVAVTDLNLRSAVEGKEASIIQLKAGDIAWVKGGFTHTLTNLGKQNARFITLEFQ